MHIGAPRHLGHLLRGERFEPARDMDDIALLAGHNTARGGVNRKVFASWSVAAENRVRPHALPVRVNLQPVRQNLQPVRQLLKLHELTNIAPGDRENKRKTELLGLYLDLSITQKKTVNCRVTICFFHVHVHDCNNR
jgi:hypothetical protein